MGAAWDVVAPEAPPPAGSSQVVALARPVRPDPDGPPDMVIPVALAAVAAVAGLATVVWRPRRARRPRLRREDPRTDGDGPVAR